MKATKEQKTKPLTATQIRAIIQRMREQAAVTYNAWFAKAEKQAEAAEKQKEKYTRLLLDEILSKSAFNVKERTEIVDLIMNCYERSYPNLHAKYVKANTDPRIAFGRYVPNPKDYYFKHDHPVERALSDVQFKLTMSDAEGYQKVMDDFNKAVKELTK